MRILRSAVLILVAASGVEAQVLAPRAPKQSDQWLVSLGLIGGFPLGEFKQYEDGGVGGEMVLGYQPWRRQPLVIRVQGGGVLYSAVGAYGYQDVCDATNGCYTERVRYNARSHAMWSFQGGPEFMATDGKWRPFAYALAGYTLFHSQANYKPTSPYSGYEYSQSLFTSHNFSTSYGGGLRWVPTKFGREKAFELSARVMRNAKAEYLTEDGLYQNADGSWSVSPRRGAANVLIIQTAFWLGPYINWNER